MNQKGAARQNRHPRKKEGNDEETATMEDREESGARKF